ncbi:MAG: sodium:solute symporter family protein [Lachnospiraceae bacterium]|nr:sodium:solute symporter family protein [Lachnospiraceae bacterium]
MSIYLGVFIGYFAIIIISSIVGAKKVETMGDFTTGGNSMGLILGVGTSVATWLSVASVMGVPGNIYSRGVCAITGWIAGWFGGTALMPLIAYKIRRPAVPTRTFPEFIHARYDADKDVSPLQIVAAVIELAGYFVFSFIQVQGFGIVLNRITGLPFVTCCWLFMIILVFTCFGGFQSVARTDTVNAILILIGVIAGAITVVNVAGGMGAIVENFATTTAPAVTGGNPIPAGSLTSTWGVFGASAIMSTFLSNSLGASVAPHWVARFMAPKNAKTGALQMFWVVIFLIPIFICIVIIGMGGKALMPSLPEGVTSDYMFPQLIINYLNPVLGSLALVAICAAAVSTANSMLLHCSTSLIYDIVRNIKFSGGKKATVEDDAKTTKVLRITILVLGVLAVIGAIQQWSFLADGFTYVYGAFGSVFFAMVWLGLYVKKMNRPAAWVSLIVGFILYFYCVTQGAPFGLPTFIVSGGCSVISAIIVMLVTKAPPVECYEAYFSDDPSEATVAAMHRIRRDDV